MPHKVRLFSPSLTPLFREHSHRVFSVLLYAISDFFDTDFAIQVVFKHWVLPVSSEVLMPITAILIPAADFGFLLHQPILGPVIVHVMVLKWTHITRITLNVSQTGCTIVSQLGFEPGLLVRWAVSQPIKPSGPAWVQWILVINTITQILKKYYFLQNKFIKIFQCNFLLYFRFSIHHHCENAF